MNSVSRAGGNTILQECASRISPLQAHNHVRFVATPGDLRALREATALLLPHAAQRVRGCPAPYYQEGILHVRHHHGQITIVYRGGTQQFATVSLATHFLWQDRIKMGWFHKITATVDLIGDDQVRQTQYLKGDKFDIMKALVQLENDIKSSKA